MKNLLLFFSILLLISCESEAPILLEIEEGVSAELATYRKSQISNVKYHLSFNIPINKEDSIDSKLILEISVQDESKPVVLDFKSNRSKPTMSIVNGESIPIQYKNEHLIIPAEHIVKGYNKIEVDFTAGEMSLNRNENYLFSLLVPDRARTLFPCFDQPDIKANYTLNITVPKDWQVLAGAEIESKTENGDFLEVKFKESDKMSTYLFSFVAGKFAVENASDSSIKSTLYHQETDSTKIRLSIDEIFRIHQRSLIFMERYTKYDFPFQKLDFAALYAHPYGGMEHTGAIQYRQSFLFLDNSATLNQKLWRAKIIAHETSHMWFGNLVTMKWFDDVWLKEVFANFMAEKIVNPEFPSINHDLSFFVNHYPSAYSIDRSIGANPIGQNLDNLNNAGSLYGDIIYHKAPIMMRQLETILGEDNFQISVQEYLAEFANENADWNDLITILDKNTKLDLKEWSDVWVNSSGRPIVNSEIQYNDLNQIESFVLEQEPEYGSKKIWPQVFELTLVYGDSLHSITVDLKKEKLELEEAHGHERPNAIIYNSNGLGYGVFPSANEELELAATIESEIARAVIYQNCHENVLNGNISIEQALKIYQKGIKSEKNELVLSILCNQIRHLFWTYLSEQGRKEVQNKITNLLFTRLESDDEPGIKKTLFNTLKYIGHTGIARDRLYEIWSRELEISNLNLNSDDFTNLAMHLIVYDHQASHEILDKARAEIEDPNKLERFDFLIPALSNDPAIRNDFFQSFKEVEKREKENWVLSACYYIHHPLRQKDAIASLALSLELLEEIQQTGDIFFPENWLNNTIGKYSSPEAYAILKKFQEENPNLKPSLNLKVLQTTDDLYRMNTIFK